MNTITSAQQATSAMIQASQQVNSLKNIAAQLQRVIANGAPASESQGLPGFAPADFATAMGANNIANIQAAITAINAI